MAKETDQKPAAAKGDDEGAGAVKAPAAAPKVAKVARDCRVRYLNTHTLDLKAGQVIDDPALARFLGDNGILAE